MRDDDSTFLLVLRWVSIYDLCALDWEGATKSTIEDIYSTNKREPAALSVLLRG